ncbi:hypothetical protein [Mycoplasma simbae]|uniref:hypothetical protein n=1 Tax=Mycoplasma simbae TaxID=36744 RepID=UPI000496B757|nr:hypothetical protein [Mycoplasma simbae]
MKRSRKLLLAISALSSSVFTSTILAASCTNPANQQDNVSILASSEYVDTVTLQINKKIKPESKIVVNYNNGLKFEPKSTDLEFFENSTNININIFKPNQKVIINSVLIDGSEYIVKNSVLKTHSYRKKIDFSLNVPQISVVKLRHENKIAGINLFLGHSFDFAQNGFVDDQQNVIAVQFTELNHKVIKSIKVDTAKKLIFFDHSLFEPGENYTVTSVSLNNKKLDIDLSNLNFHVPEYNDATATAEEKTILPIEKQINGNVELSARDTNSLSLNFKFPLDKDLKYVSLLSFKINGNQRFFGVNYFGKEAGENIISLTLTNLERDTQYVLTDILLNETNLLSRQAVFRTAQNNLIIPPKNDPDNGQPKDPDNTNPGETNPNTGNGSNTGSNTQQPPVDPNNNSGGSNTGNNNSPQNPGDNTHNNGDNQNPSTPGSNHDNSNHGDNGNGNTNGSSNSGDNGEQTPPNTDNQNSQPYNPEPTPNTGTNNLGANIDNYSELVLNRVEQTSSDNQSKLIFHFSGNPKAKNKELSFNIGIHNYGFNYDGNSSIFVINIDQSNIPYLESVRYNDSIIAQNIQVSQKEATNSQLTNSYINSVSYNGTTISASGNIYSLGVNKKVMLTFKPYDNVYDADVTLEGVVQNGQIFVADASKINKGYSRYVLTSAYELDSLKRINVNENIEFTINNNYNSQITSVSFNKVDSTNEFIGNIQLNVRADEIAQYKNKYLKLTFVDQKQNIATNANLEWDRDRYAFDGTGFDFREKQRDYEENHKYVFLNLDELSNFRISHLTEGINWQLLRIELVNKHNLRTVKDYDISSFINNLSDLSTTIFEETHSFTDALGNSFKSQINNIDNSSHITRKDLEDRYFTFTGAYTTDYTADSEVNKNVALNYENYKVLNNFYIKNTQKMFAVLPEADYLPTGTKLYIPSYNIGGLNYNYATLIENYKQKEFQESQDRTTYTIRKKLSQFQNLDSQKDVIFNFNFFASIDNINLGKWTQNTDSYAVSFSYDQLKNAASHTLDNIKIDFIQDWNQIYTRLNKGTDKSDLYKKLHTDEELAKLINQRLKAKVTLDNDGYITIELQARKGRINKDIYIHNLSQNYSTFVEKAQNYFSLMYIENESQPLKFVSENIDSYANIGGFLFDKKTNFKPKTAPEEADFAATEWRTKNHLTNDKILKEVVARSFGVDYGSGWIVAKVDPDNDADNWYYFATNGHVPVSPSTIVNSPLLHNDKTDTTTTRGSIGEWYTDNEFVWAATNNRKIDGSEVTGKSAPIRSAADIWIYKMNIKPLIDYYNQHKDNASMRNSDKFKAAEHAYNWKNLNKNVKVSRMSRYIKRQQFVSLYASSFPGSNSGRTKKNVQVRFNYMAEFFRVNPGDHNLGYSDQYTVFRTFKGEKNGEADHLLTGGSSGTGIYDAEGNIYGIHAASLHNYSLGYVLNSQYINFLGELNDYNEGSFAALIQRRNRLYPEKYKMINIFNEFEKPFIK